MMAALCQPKDLYRGKHGKRERADLREVEKLARRRNGGRGTSVHLRPDRNRQMPAVFAIADERARRNPAPMSRLELSFEADSQFGQSPGTAEARAGATALQQLRGTHARSRARRAATQRAILTGTGDTAVPNTKVSDTRTKSSAGPGPAREARGADIVENMTRSSEGEILWGSSSDETPPKEGLRPPLSRGDPKQFILSGSIGDRLVRVLVDTGATISFISKNLVARLKPTPEVLKSELSVMMGNGETHDTNHYVEVDLVLDNTSLPGKFHLLELPPAFDAIAGLDWLSKHGVHIHARARTVTIEGAEGSVGKRINVAGCAAISHGLPTRMEGTDWGDLQHTLCYLDPTVDVRKDGMDSSHIEVKTGSAFNNTIQTLSAVERQGAMVMTDLWMQPRPPSRIERRKGNDMMGNEEVLANFSHRQRQAYMASSTEEERDEWTKLKDEFKDIQVSVLPEEEINKTYPPQKGWADHLLANQDRYQCLRPMPETVLMEGDDPLTIEDKPGLTTRPPHRQYKTPRHLLPELERFITEMLEKRWIEPSKSEYSSPVLIIPKPSGKGYRFVVDLRQVNDRTKRINYYMPDISGMFEKLKGAAFISCLDLEKGYWQAPLDPATKHKTAFSCEFGSFQYRVVPMGLLSSAQFYQSFVEKKLDRHGILYKKVHASSDLKDTYLDSDGVRCKGFVGVFIDDLIVFSSSADLHREHLLALFETLSTENLYLNGGKCHLFARYVRFLGCVVGQNTIYMDGEKIRAILEMPEPRGTQSEVRAFLGAVAFYRRWLSDFSEMSAPLVELLKGKEKNISGRWGPRQSEAVTTLKRAITRYPVLRQFDQNKQIFVVTDASDYAIGGCLYQHHEGKPCAIQYISRQMTPAEKNYDVREKECLAVKYCLEKLRHYLLCTKFTIKCLSDHRSLTFLKNGREMGGRIARWALSLGEYDYTIEYIKGTDNTLADVLSRMVAAEKRGGADGHVGDDEAEKHTLANMTPDVYAAVEMHHCHVHDERTDRVIAKEAEYDLTLFGTHAALPTRFCAATVTEENTEQLHESVMFAAARYRQNFVHIKRVHYETCPDFGEVYAAVWNKSGRRPPLVVKPPTPPHEAGAETKSRVASTKRGRKSTRDPKRGGQATHHMSKVQPHLENYEIRGELLYVKAGPSEHTHMGDRLCVPTDAELENRTTCRLSLVAEIHDNAFTCHPGTQKTLQELKRRVYWPDMRADVTRYVKACPECQRFKIDRQRPQGKLVPTQTPMRPGTHYSIDFMTGLPKSGRQEHDAILVVVDRFSKKVRCLPTWKKASGKLVAELFINHVMLGPDGQGVPMEIISDRDARFTPPSAKAKQASFWEEFFAHIGTSIRLSTARHQRTDGMTERMIASIQDLMRIGIDYKQSNWTRLLPRIVFTINNLEARSTGFSPFFIERGRDPLIPLDRDRALESMAPQREDTQTFLERIWDIESQVTEKLMKAKEHQAQFFDKHKSRPATVFEVGDEVWLSTKGITMPWDKDRKSKKLTARFYGPFEVLRQTSPVTYELKLPAASNIHPIFHVSLLKIATQLKGFKAPKLPDGDNKDEYEVESILAHRSLQGGKKKYLVKWKGYTFEECTWEPQANFNGDALQVYHKALKEAKHEDSASEDDDSEDQ